MKKSALAAAMALSFGYGSAHAIYVLPGLNTYEDDNIEQFIDVEGDPDTLDVGDSLRGVITIGTWSNPTGGSVGLGDFAGAPNELTAIFESEVTSKVDVGGGIFRFEFGPSAGFEATYGAGAMVAFFEGPTNLDVNPDDGSMCAGTVACEDAATDGNPWAIFGIADADDEWFSFPTLSDVPGVIGGQPGSSSSGTANIALSLLVNNTGGAIVEQDIDCVIFACDGDGRTEFAGSGPINGGLGLVDPYFARSDFQFQLVAVPEPASLALLGLGLAGMAGGAAARRKKRPA